MNNRTKQENMAFLPTSLLKYTMIMGRTMCANILKNSVNNRCPINQKQNYYHFEKVYTTKKFLL